MKRTGTLFILFTLLSCAQLFAWSGGGHMVIAAEAYKELSSGLKARVDKILESHLNYAEWKSSYEQSVKSMDLNLYVFTQVAH